MVYALQIKYTINIKLINFIGYIFVFYHRYYKLRILVYITYDFIKIYKTFGLHKFNYETSVFNYEASVDQNFVKV